MKLLNTINSFLKRKKKILFLDAGQRIAKQRLVPGGVFCDAIISKPQRFLLRGCEVLQHNHRHLGDAERRGGSVCLNSSGAFPKWVSALVRPPSGLMAAR